MTPNEAVTSAWGALQYAWAVRWFFIVMAGSGVPALCWVLREDVHSTGWRQLHRLGALVALALVLSSTRFVVDTYRLESEGAAALSQAQCVVRDAGRFELDCADGQSFSLFVTPTDERLLVPGEAVEVWHLPWSHLAVGVTVPRP